MIEGTGLNLAGLSKAGEGSALKNAPKMVNDLVYEFFAQYGKEKSGYDLLDDKTGIVNADLDDFKSALNSEMEKTLSDEDYVPTVYSLYEDDKCTIFQYNSDNEKSFETYVKFDKETGSLISQEVYNENDRSTAGINFETLDYRFLSGNGLIRYNEFLETITQDNKTYKIEFDSNGNAQDLMPYPYLEVTKSDISNF